MYTPHTSTLAFKDNPLGSRVPTWASMLVCTSDQFHSSCKSGSNHTPRMRTGSSLQQKGLGRVSLPTQAPSHKPSLLSKLTLVPAIYFILGNHLLHRFYVQAVEHKDHDIIGERGNPCCKRASKRDIAQGRICPLIPKPLEQELLSENIKRRWEQPCQTDHSITNALECLLLTCTTGT